ncbi:MAG: radical SAM protein, partial [Deltaproteobacteria bacterium]|nr:radical SAM protein [Deltaproteobacteria bacterium]
MSHPIPLQQNNESARRKYVPTHGVFESTLACNLRCRHCGSSAGQARSDQLDTAECQRLFGELKSLGLKRLTISGGEPTTRPDWARLIELCTDVQLKVSMFTNAVTLTDDDIRKAKDNGLASLAFSLDGLEATHDHIRGKKGHFKILQQAMDSCRRIDMPFAVVSTLCNDNISQLRALHQFVADQGAYAWQVQPGNKMGNLSHHPELHLSQRALPRIEQILAELMVVHPLKVLPGDSLGYFGPNDKIIRRNCGGAFGGCGAGIHTIGIECNGNIKGCLSILPGYNHSGGDFVEGNIRDTPLAEIWHREDAFAATRKWQPADLSGFCSSCEHANQCRGGCLGKRITDGTPSENTMCTWRVLAESNESSPKIAKAASLFFAASLASTGMVSCSDSDDPVPLYAAPPVTEPEEEDETETEDTETDTETGTETDTMRDSETGTETDTETDTSDSEMMMPIYSTPDVEPDTSDSEMMVPVYSSPDVEPDTSDSEMMVPVYSAPDVEPDTSD